MMNPEAVKYWAEQQAAKPRLLPRIDQAEAVRLARVALQECPYRAGGHPNDWSEAALAVCRFMVDTAPTP